jgi:hypothetical protein
MYELSTIETKRFSRTANNKNYGRQHCQHQHEINLLKRQ